MSAQAGVTARVGKFDNTEQIEQSARPGRVLTHRQAEGQQGGDGDGGEDGEHH